MSEMPDPTPELPRQPGISLHELTEAFAQAMGYDAELEHGAEAGADFPPGDAELPDSPPDVAAGQTTCEPAPAISLESESSGDDACPVSPTSILEAMLFVGNRDNRPLTPQQAAGAMRGVEPEEVVDLVAALNRQYAARGCPYCIAGEGDGYRMTLRPSFHRMRDKFYRRVREMRLSQAAINVLAIVAYQQPVTADRVAELRGKPSRDVLTQLVRRGLLRVERLTKDRRTTQYGTADRFLELFDLAHLSELPRGEDIDKM